MSQSSKDRRANPEFSCSPTPVPPCGLSAASWDLLGRRLGGAKICAQQQKTHFMGPPGNSTPVCLMQSIRADFKEGTSVYSTQASGSAPFFLLCQIRRPGSHFVLRGSTFHRGVAIHSLPPQRPHSPLLSSSCSWFKPLPAPANNALSRSDRITVSHWFHMSQIIVLMAHHIEVVRTLLRL